MSSAVRTWCRLFWLLPLGCAAPQAEVAVPEVSLPAAYSGANADGPSAATQNWREYFADDRLTDLIELALRNNPDLLVAIQRAEAARAAIQRATGALWPSAAVAAGASLRKFGDYTMDGAGNASTDITPGRRVPTHLPDFSVGLQSSWEVDIWGKLRSQRGSAAARYLATLEGTSFAVTGLVAAVGNAYFELVALDHTREVLAETVARQEQALGVVQLQKQAGRANELAVKQFEAQVASTRAIDVSARERTQLLENQTSLLLGRLPQPIARTPDAQLERVARSLSLGIPSDLLKNRPDIRRAELEVQAAECDLDAARAAFFPRFQISAGVGFQAFEPRYLFSTPESITYSVLGGLLAPLVNRSGIEADFAAARAHQIEALVQYQKAIVNGFVEVASGLALIERAAEAVDFRRAQHAAASGAVDAADTLYRAGKATYFEVLIAQQNTLAAELDLIQASKRQRQASVALYRALGGGWR
jgi:multidrug efflux system outer membrane protein